MIIFAFKNILELIKAFPDEQSCITELEAIRWPDGVTSPFDSTSKVYKYKNNIYRCRATSKNFNVKTGTMFDNTKIELQKWFLAIWLATNHKKGISSAQLARDIDVTQKTAWFMLQRIRNCFGIENESQLSGEIELDETFVGGKNKNRHGEKKVKNSQGRSFKDKTPVMGMLQRGESFMHRRDHGVFKGMTISEKVIVSPAKLVCHVIADTRNETLQPIIMDTVERGSVLYSDEWIGYKGLGVNYSHSIVDHGAKQYVNGNATTNRVENVWSHFKRSIIGIYHYTSRKHLQLYVNEMVYRYNTRTMTDSVRFINLLANSNRRLTYKKLIGK